MITHIRMGAVAPDGSVTRGLCGSIKRFVYAEEAASDMVTGELCEACENNEEYVLFLLGRAGEAPTRLHAKLWGTQTGRITYTK